MKHKKGIKKWQSIAIA